MVVYIIISLFAIYGFINLINDIIGKIKVGCSSCGGRLCLYPYPGDEGLEGKIRSIFLNEVTEKIGTDGFLYIKLEEDDPNRKLVEKLCAQYPRLVLMDNLNWGRIKDEKQKISERERVSNG
ncbi:MAG: hypothetical protein GX213_12825 [Clostridiaceae bacterium]|nr:hypothetical protein [Clostridiaceae bacterium]